MGRGIRSPVADSLTLLVKAVPGARRTEVAGWLGERLKVRVSAPPEGGKANDAIRELLAAELGLKPAAVSIIRGQSNPEKTVQITGVSLASLQARWPRPDHHPA